MTAPKRPPWFFDSLSGAEHTYPDTGADAAWLVDRLASEARHFPDWRVDVDDACAIPVKLALLDPITEPPRVRIRASTADCYIDIVAGVDPSGWTLVTATLDGAEIFRAYVDHPYEEYNLFPSGSTVDPKENAPGRMGKKMAWICLSITHWPALAPLSSQGWFNACVAER